MKLKLHIYFLSIFFVGIGMLATGIGLGVGIGQRAEQEKMLNGFTIDHLIITTPHQPGWIARTVEKPMYSFPDRIATMKIAESGETHVIVLELPEDTNLANYTSEEFPGSALFGNTRDQQK